MAYKVDEKPEPIRKTIKKAIRGGLTLHQINDDGTVSEAPQSEKKEHWGYHLLVGFGQANKNIDSEEKIKEFYKKLFKVLEVKELSEIVIKRALPEEGRGLSAMQMLTTSSVTLHTDDEGYDGYLDVFVCAPFKPEPVISLVEEFFTPKIIHKFFVARDVRPYPK